MKRDDHLRRSPRSAAALFAILCLGACPSDAPTQRDGTPGRDAPADGPGQDGSRQDGLRQDGLRQDGLRRDGPRQDAPRRDGPSTPPDTMAPDYGKCGPPIVPKNPKDAWALRATSAGFGGITTQNIGGHSDVFLKSPNQRTRIGARLDWGGTLVFFGKVGDPLSNVIDDNDTGRELQIALYDQKRKRQGCAHNASCPSTAGCGAKMTFLGWNPVQGGDECGHGAKVLSHGRQGDSLVLVTRPIQWNPDWAATTCVQNSCGAQGLPVQVTYTTELRFLSDYLVEVSTQVTSQETISHQATGQEWPTMYVSFGKNGDPDFCKLFDASHKLIALTTLAPDDHLYYKIFNSPAPWVAFQTNAENYGVGLAMDQGVRSFMGYGGPKPPNAIHFHNVRAVVTFGLGAGATVRGRSYIALGDFPTIKAELESALKKRPPFGWVDGPATIDVSYAKGSNINVQGWTLDTARVNNVSVKIDGVTRATIPVSVTRSDVCKVYPAYGGCSNARVGFNGNVPTTGLEPDCSHLLQVIATDTDGNSSILGERKLTQKP